MEHNEIYMSLEISESSIKAIVAEYFNGKVHVLASAQRDVPTEFNEYNFKELEKAVVKTKEEIASLLGYDIKNTILIIPSNNCKKFSDKIKVESIYANQVITKDEIAKGLEDLAHKNDTKEDFVVNVLIDRYSAYGYGYVSNPVGLETRYIEIEASVYTVPTTSAYPLIKLVEDAGFNVVDVCLDIVAIAQHSVADATLKAGAVIVDMNADSTNVAYFKNNTLKSYSNIEIGGKHITNDIKLCSQVEFEKAEQFKKKYVNLRVNDNLDLVIYKFYDEINDEEVSITQQFISEVALSRVEEIISLVNTELSNIGLQDGDVVYITGAANRINGLDNVLTSKLNFPYKICSNTTFGARSSAFIKCLGAIENEAAISRIRGEIKLFVNKNAYIDSINLVEKNNLLYNSNSKSESDFINRLVSYIFNN
ncbi:MAG: cell division FtsA domain-containing protein [Erysipelotrichales bacterium]